MIAIVVSNGFLGPHTMSSRMAGLRFDISCLKIFHSFKSEFLHRPYILAPLADSHRFFKDLVFVVSTESHVPRYSVFTIDCR